MKKFWESDRDLFRIARRELFPALVGDILDKMGLYHQFLPAGIKPISPHMVVIGRAMPVLEADVFAESQHQTQNPLMKKPFGMMFEALDSLQPDEVYICTGSSPVYALWGGLMANRARYLGAAGAVLDGFSRDTSELLKLDLPAFSLGTYAQDQGPRGKVIDYRIPIEFGGIRVDPGDIVFGDRDGVLIVPAHAADEAFVAAFEKSRTENKVRQALVEGVSAVDVFATYQVM